MADTGERVGIVIEAVDKATNVFDSVEKAGKSALEGVRAGAKKAGDAMKLAGTGVVIFNQALELGKKAVEVFRAVVLDNIRAMVEYRGENDKVAKQFREMADDFQLMRATIADVLTPIFLGFNEALKDTADSFIDLVNANRQMIAINIATFLADVARVLIKGVAFGATLVSRAVSGIIEAYNLLASIVTKVTALQLEGIKKFLDGATKVASLVDTEFSRKLQGGLQAASEAVGALGDEFDKASNDHMAAVEHQVAAQQKLEDTINNTKDVLLNFTDFGLAKIIEFAENGWGKVRRKTDEATQAVFDYQVVFSRAINDQISQIERRAELEFKNAQYLDQLEQQRLATSQQVAQGIATSYGQAFARVAAGSESASSAIINTTIDAAQTAVMTYAASAAAGAMSSQSAIPVVGPYLALIIGPIIFAAVRAMLSTIPKAYYGGIASGGPQGRDQIGAFVDRGEGVLRHGQTASITRLADSIEKHGLVTSRGPVINQTVNFTSLGSMPTAEAARAARDQQKLLRRAAARGY